MARAQTNIEPAALEAGLSKRLAARLGAFERRGVFISDVLLEVLVDEGEPQGLKRLLLSPLLNGDEMPTPEFFAQLLAESDDGWLQDNPLQLITNGDIACIALADEAPQLELEGATPASNDDEPTKSESKGLSVNNAANLPALKRGDAERVFGADALAQVKLTLLTSTNENEKIEAIRKLALSPLAGEEKLQLFLIALRDIARGVRAEASRGLGSLGLDGRIADNLARACQADEKERLVALSNLNQLLAHADQAEEALMVGVATGLLVSSESSPMISSALNLLEEIIRRSETLSDEVLTTLHRRIQELLLVPRPEVLRPLRRLYAALIERRAELVTSLIEASLEEVAPQHLRNFFLSVLLTSKDSGARSGANIRALIEAILSSDEIDPSFNHMRTALRELGADARDAVASVFESGNESRRVRLLETLADIIAAENAAQHTESLFELILDAFEDGSQRMRTAIYDSSVLRSEKLEGDQAQRAAALLLADIHEHELEATQEIVTGAI
ncbi:MAG: hypothetical protein KDB07_06275, partial [Planctomycetes bacterium]|nr:hypothetical protein [Planctomycetota bacterium]